VRSIDVAERQARLARRHRLTPSHRAADVVDATTSVVCLHGTDPSTVYLSAWARLDHLDRGDLARALYDERTLVKHLAMRRTLFVFARDALGPVQAGASDAVAERERKTLIRDVERAGLHDDGARWLGAASVDVLAVLADGRHATSSELRDLLPSLQGSITYGEGRSWGGQVPVGPRVLTTLSAAGKVLRATNDGGWTVSRPRWASTDRWLGHPVEPWTEPDGVAWLVERWLRAFGPGTEADLKWWLGSTLTKVRRALAHIGAVEVDLDRSTGWLLPDDVEPAQPVEPWVALLPPLDPTTMGWFEREWYLGPYRSQLFDTSGNAGPTIWCDGRIVGGWRQEASGEVTLQLLEDLDPARRRQLDEEAGRLTDWFGGVRALPRFPSPLSKSTDTG
jgi:hypothetical protein